MHSSFAAYYCTSETSAVCPLLALAPALPIPRGFSHSLPGVSGYVASLVRVSGGACGVRVVKKIRYNSSATKPDFPRENK